MLLDAQEMTYVYYIMRVCIVTFLTKSSDNWVHSKSRREWYSPLLSGQEGLSQGTLPQVGNLPFLQCLNMFDGRCFGNDGVGRLISGQQTSSTTTDMPTETDSAH